MRGDGWEDWDARMSCSRYFPIIGVLMLFPPASHPRSHTHTRTHTHAHTHTPRLLTLTSPRHSSSMLDKHTMQPHTFLPSEEGVCPVAT
eukprot:8415548-Pyramimonas_sp.AAC.1